MPDLQPTLIGKLVHLRPLRQSDWNALFAVASDPLVWEQHPRPDRCTEPVFREFFDQALESGGALLATDAATGEVVGSSRFRHDQERGEIEIGWTFLARSHWGGRYNAEMKRLMLRHAFQFVDCVVFYIGGRNVRSQKAVEKLGASRAGFGRDDGSGSPSVRYELTREQFALGAVQER
ncbi:MAG: GNAT family N-acetyltransferase [Chloroflexi bacterium]|nr:GNAT family N-acetyltransferase [Chloroflexota bacterium]